MARSSADQALTHCEEQRWIVEVRPGSSGDDAEAAVWALTPAGRAALAASPAPDHPNIGDLSDALWRESEYGLTGWIVAHRLADSAVVTTQQVAHWLHLTTEATSRLLRTWEARPSGWCSRLDRSRWVLLGRDCIRASERAEDVQAKQAKRFRAEKEQQRTGHPAALAAHIEASVVVMAAYLADPTVLGQVEHEPDESGPGLPATRPSWARSTASTATNPTSLGHVLSDTFSTSTPLTYVRAPGPKSSGSLDAPAPPRRVSRKQRAAWADYRSRAAEQVRRERAAREPVSR